MNVVETVQSCIQTWGEGGAAKCLSFVAPPHSNPSDPDSNEVLSTAYQTLINSILKTWSPNASLTSDTFVEFVQSVLDRLPSSSANSHSSNVTLFGEILVDLIWATDAELEDILVDARNASANAEQAGAQGGEADGPAVNHADLVVEILKAKENVESDKDTLVDITKRLLAIGVLDGDVCRERLDTSLIANVSLITDKVAFEKKEIRTRTGLFYKQNKFNLLREQSEGFSKLTAEITSSLGSPHSPATGLPSEAESAIVARASATWDRVLRLIGFFDLDPNRALDVILDVFSVHLATHWRFFLAFLSVSPWSSRSSKRKAEEGMDVEPNPEQYRGKTLDEILELAEVNSGYIAPSPFSPNGSNARVLAQVLGFKFSYYQSPDVTETTPKSLYLMAALLIREGFITVEDLYLHITPTDEGMGELHKKYLASIDTRIAGAKVSQLAMAAPLSDGAPIAPSKTRPSPVVETKKAAETKDLPNQKLGLLNALFAIGAMRPAFALLSKFRWMVDAFPEIADLILRIVKHSFQPLWDQMIPTKAGTTSFTRPRARYSSSGVVTPERRPQLTLWAPTPPCSSTAEFVFFFPKWTERVPVCSSVQDLVDIVEPMLKFVGLHGSRDPHFLIKLTKIGRLVLQDMIEIEANARRPSKYVDIEDPMGAFWFKVARLYLLPAMPLIQGNAVCAVDIWSMLKHYDHLHRWKLYGEWRDKMYKSYPELRVRSAQAVRESKAILRRLSSNTQNLLAGTVAKLAHSNPCIFFQNAINQVMAYDNLGNAITQSLYFCTIMGFDILIFLILDALANPNKERMKADGVNVSDWLQSMASFTGMIFRRYSADLHPVLDYVVHQLQNGQSTDLVVFKELIWKMAGIEPLPSLTNSQIVAMAGGPILRIEAVASTFRGARLNPSDAGYKGPQRLGRALVESSTALPLLILIAQQRQSCVFQNASSHVKALASTFDLTHGVLLQYLELLNDPEVTKPGEYEQKIVPKLKDLNQLYGIHPAICMQIVRPILHTKLLEAAKEMQEKERIASEEAEKRLKAALREKREPNVSTSRIASPAIGDASTTAESNSTQTKEGSQDAQPNGTPMEVEGPVQNSPPVEESPWLPQLVAYFEDIKTIIPQDAADVIRPGFYTTFWQMSAYDICPPTERYHEESMVLRELSRKEDELYSQLDRSYDKTRRSEALTHRDKRNRINRVVQELSEEAKTQTTSRMFTLKRLQREKNHWFSHSPPAQALATAVIEHCLHPRCLLSPMDADYCAQMVKVIHLQGTPGFSTLMCYDKLLGDHMRVIIFSCSEYEARNYGRFLHGILVDIMKWHNDEQAFMQDNRTKVGGKPVYLPGFQMKWSSKSVVAIEDIIKWSDFKTLAKKWHRKLSRNLLHCLESGHFVHIYNALLVLKELLGVFPRAEVFDTAGVVIKNVVESILKEEKRGDLKILGKSYSASLTQRESEWKVPENAKIEVPVKATPTAPAVRENHKVNGIPVGPSKTSASAPDRRAATTTPVSAPSAPRAQLSTTPASTPPPSVKPVPLSTKAIESIPRPEVVRRVRPDNKTPPAIQQPSASSNSDAMNVDPPPVDRNGAPHSVAARSSAGNASGRPASPSTLPPLPKDLAMLRDSSRPSTPSQLATGRPLSSAPQSPRVNGDEPRAARPESTQTMPPPNNPSQTSSAQELRETARQSRQAADRDEKASRSNTDARQVVPPNAPSSSRRRSPSPTSRPGTRNHSAESRGSGGRTRDGARDEDRRDSRVDSRDTGRRDRERRSTRESEREKDADRDRDRRDRHGRDRDRERDRDKDRDRERDRERDRDRDRGDRDRDRDRHRRDEKDRDRKDREPSTRGSAATVPAPIPDDRGLPSRPDTARHRGQHGEDSLGKRRRPADDESDRASKRPSRKESHHEDRSRRTAEKDSHDRPSDRRRKDRETAEGENKSLSIDTKIPEKRIPEGPASGRSLPPTTPSAPRAMSSGDASRSQKSDPPNREREWRQRDQPTKSTEASTAPETGGSLRSRIGEKDSRPLPQAPSSHRADGGDRGQSDAGNKDDDRDGRKRTLSDRDRDVQSSSKDYAEQTTYAPKRLRIKRDRYKMPIDSEKTRSARND